MDEKDTLFIKNDLLIFLNEEINMIFTEMNQEISEVKNLDYFKNKLINLKLNILNIEYDINYHPMPIKKTNGVPPFQIQKAYFIQRFKFTGNQKFFTLTPKHSTTNPPVGQAIDGYLYFETSIPYVENVQKLNELLIKEIDLYTRKLEFYINSQKQDVENFINECLIKLENQYNLLIKEKLFLTEGKYNNKFLL